MADLRVTLPADDISWTVDLFESKAPELCGAIREALPLETELVHGKFSGEEVYAPTDREAFRDLPKENLTYDVAAGDVGYWDSHRDDGAVVRDRAGFGELVFIYGRQARPRMGADHPVAIDLIGRVRGNLDAFEAAAARRQHDGSTTVRVGQLDG
jgi:hypothetical protein